MRRWRHILASWLLLAVAAGFAPGEEPWPKPKLSRERILLHTVAGDIVLALYPEAAPKHTGQILRLVRLGVYDSTHFYRVQPGYVAQLSDASDRLMSFTPEQQQAIQPIPGEFGPLPHRLGELSMARWPDRPDSAKTSFSILLGSAPHLDGKFTVFGRVVQGFDVLNEFLRVPRGQEHDPVVRLEVFQAEVIDSPEQLAAISLAKARKVPVPPGALPGSQDSLLKQRLYTVAGGVTLMMLIDLTAFLSSRRIGLRGVLALCLMNVLAGAFLLLVALGPEVNSLSWIGGALLLVLLGVIRLMGQMERSEG